MATFKPIIIADFKGLGTRWDPSKTPPGMLTAARNIRFREESIVPRPGLSIAIRVPLVTDCIAVEAAPDMKTFILKVSV